MKISRIYTIMFIGLFLVLLMADAVVLASEKHVTENESIIIIDDCVLPGGYYEGKFLQKVRVYSVSDSALEVVKEFYINGITGYAKNIRYVNEKREFVYFRSFILNRADDGDLGGRGTCSFGMMVKKNLLTGKDSEETFYHSLRMKGPDEGSPSIFYLTEDDNLLIANDHQSSFVLVDLNKNVEKMEKSWRGNFINTRFGTVLGGVILNMSASRNNEKLSYLQLKNGVFKLYTVKFPEINDNKTTSGQNSLIAESLPVKADKESASSNVPEKRWSPKGDKILFTKVSRDKMDVKIIIINVETGKEETLLSLGNLPVKSNPDFEWTANGILITLYDSVYLKLKREKILKKIQLPKGLVDLSGGRLSPSGNKIMFFASEKKSSNNSYRRYLCVVSLDSGKVSKKKISFDTDSLHGNWFVKDKRSIIRNEFFDIGLDKNYTPGDYPLQLR